MATRIEIGSGFHCFDPKTKAELDWSESGVPYQQVSDGHVILLSSGQHIAVQNHADVITVNSVQALNGGTNTEGTYKSLYHFHVSRFQDIHFPTLDFKLEGPAAVLSLHNIEMGEVKITNDPEPIG